MSADPNSLPKPSSPPPAYTELADPSQYAGPPSQSNYPNQPGHPVVQSQPRPYPSPSHHHATYGPTPIAQQTHLLPYYDLRSNYAVAEAASRARWRFAVAWIWAMVILLFLGILFGTDPQQLGGRDGPGQFGSFISRLDRWSTWKDR